VFCTKKEPDCKVTWDGEMPRSLGENSVTLSRGYSLPFSQASNRRLTDPFRFGDAKSVAPGNDLRAPLRIEISPEINRSSFQARWIPLHRARGMKIMKNCRLHPELLYPEAATSESTRPQGAATLYRLPKGKATQEMP
jgi:hypothetical protein